MKKNNAFTLVEILIALAVVGILIAIIMPIIFNLMPDKNALMAKRAYYTVQTITSDLLNNEACYPDKTQADGTEKRVGFDDGYGYADCTKWGGSDDTEKYIDKEDANLKFLTLFTNKLDLKIKPDFTLLDNENNQKLEREEIQEYSESLPKQSPAKNIGIAALSTGTSASGIVNNGGSVNAGGLVEDTTKLHDISSDLNNNVSTVDLKNIKGIQFTTKDGVLWTVQNNKLEYTNSDPYIEFLIDVNGADKPNCKDNTGTCANKKDLDQFTVRIHANGKIDILEDWASEVVNANHDVTGNQK